MLHVHYEMAGAQLCTIPTPGFRLKEQPLPEMLLFAITERTWTMPSTTKLLKHTPLLIALHQSKPSARPCLTPGARKFNSTTHLQELEGFVEQPRWLPRSLRINWLYTKCLEKYLAHSRHSLNVGYYHGYVSPHPGSVGVSRMLGHSFPPRPQLQNEKRITSPTLLTAL